MKFYPLSAPYLKFEESIYVKECVKSEWVSSSGKFITKFEEKVYLEIDNYLDKLINVAKPKKLIYLAIDGVAPRAKMEQQRIRRYRTIKQKSLEETIYKKYSVIRNEFDTNCITPGTIFMYKLSDHLRKYITKKNNTLK
mgnify:CR=1 FL=1